METDWVTAQGFELSQSLIAAINDLAISIKLANRHKEAERHLKAALAARARLAEFLSDIEPLAERAESSDPGPLLGAAPAVSALTRQIVGRHVGERGELRGLAVARIREMRQLLAATSDDERARLLEYLSELRTLLERHIQASAEQIIGTV